jgi:hypothetical protein
MPLVSRATDTGRGLIDGLYIYGSSYRSAFPTLRSRMSLQAETVQYLTCAGTPRTVRRLQMAANLRYGDKLYFRVAYRRISQLRFHTGVREIIF